MADKYIPDNVPVDYDSAWLTNELQRIADFIAEIETPWVVLTPVYVAPVKPREGMVVNADGTSWNPGGGGGLYQYLASTWTKL